MTDTWTDTDLDAALSDLAATLDPAPGDVDAALTRARARLAGATTTAAAAEPVADVLDLGDVRAARPVRPTGWVAGLLVAAALVAAVTLAVVFWPRTTDRATPLGPGHSRSATSDAAPSDLLPQPLPPVGRSYTVITSTTGVGDAVVPFTPLTSALDLAGNPITLTYNFVCGLPDVAAADRPRPAPSDQPASALDASVTDNRGDAGGAAACAGLADGRRALDTSSFDVTDVVGRDEVRVDVQDPTTVWKLTVTAASG